MMSNFGGGSIDRLLDEKSLTIEQRRKIIATSAAINLITVAVTTQGSSHKLCDEMQQLSKYVEAIENALDLTRR